MKASPTPARLVAVVGAESTGKTALAQALVEPLQQLTGQRVRWVPEALRLWCEQQGRTPTIDEQPAIAQLQREAIEDAARTADLVVCDTTPLMIAVYSQFIFGSDHLVDEALQWHRRCLVTLLTATDIAWQPDGHLRDGPHVREPVDRMLRELLDAHALPWARVGGHGEQRLSNALAALRPLLIGRTR